MKVIKINKVSKAFIEAMKAHVIEAKERHKKLFAQITPEMIEKLKNK